MDIQPRGDDLPGRIPTVLTGAFGCAPAESSRGQLDRSGSCCNLRTSPTYLDFLAKPIDPLEVRTRCRNLLLLAHQYRSVKNYSLLQKRKLDHLQELLRSLAGDRTQDCAQRMEDGELVTVPYDKLFAITSCVAGVQELVVAAQRYITDLEAQLTRPLRRTED